MSFAEVTLAVTILAGLPLTGAEPDRIVIGLLVTTGPSAEALTEGAEQAVNEINMAGGIDGRDLELARLAVGGPWSDGAGLTARLVFEERVVGLIGPTADGAAHVAAQIATRKRIPVITLSPEESLTQAMVPWVFRGVPGDGAQARALLRGLFEDPQGKTALLAVPDGRSGRERATAVRSACRDLGVRVVETLVGDQPAGDDSTAADVLLLWLDAAQAVGLLQALGREGTPQRILGSTRLDTPELVGALPDWAKGLVLPLLRGDSASPVVAPGIHHALGYDGIRALADAARRRGREPEALRRGLGETQVHGHTGTFAFDSRGNRVGSIEFGVVRNGQLLRPRLRGGH